MEIIKGSLRIGVDEAWKGLAGLDPVEVCRRTSALFDRKAGVYRLKVFSATTLIDTKTKTVYWETQADSLLLGSIHNHLSLAVPVYLLHAQYFPPTGRFIKPSAMKGGQIYVAGSHVLPLHKIADQYGNNSGGFREQGRKLGGKKIVLADASVLLAPFPLVNMVLLLWQKDEEFPARADLLFDAACEFQLPSDVMWLTAMMSITAML